MFIVAFVSVLAVIFINGFTDAANAIATAVGTKALGMKQACVLSGVMNFAGVLLTSVFRPNVAETLYNMISIQPDGEVGQIFVAGAMFSVVIWAVAAWFFGIPTSESHALIASLSGCAVALQGGFDGIDKQEWNRVLIGLVLSAAIGFVCSFVLEKFSQQKEINLPTRQLQKASAALLSFLHGAQDGQKFLGVFQLLFAMVSSDSYFRFSRFTLILLCSVFMGVGTLLGGKRIILSVGEHITPLHGMQGLISDFSACLGIAVSTYTGLPVSTTHVKTTSVIGVGMADNEKPMNGKLIKDIVLTWVLTFPGCAFLGYLLTKLFLIFT